MPVVYVHTRLDTNEVFYVGIGAKKERAYHTNSRNRFWKAIVAKTEYSVKIVTEVDEFKLALEIEKYLVCFYGRKNLGLGTLCNLTDGGEGALGRKWTEETRNKQKIASVCRKKRGPLTQEQRDRISKTKKGSVVTPETRLKISLANKGKVFSEETKKKLSEKAKNRTYSPETRLKMSEAAKKRVIKESTRLKFREKGLRFAATEEGKKHYIRMSELGMEKLKAIKNGY